MKNNINRGRFRMIFSGHNLAFTTQDIVSIEIPNLSVSATDIPLLNGYSAKRTTGNPIDFGELSVSFFLDEDLSIFQFFFDWMMRGNSPIDGKAIEDIRQAELQILSPAGNPLAVFQFKGLQVLNLNSFTLEVNNEDTNYEIFPVSFSYDYFTMKRGGKL